MNGLMGENIRWAPFGALVLCLVVATGFWKIGKSLEQPLKPFEASTQAKKKPQPVMEGKVAPEFTLPLLTGGNISLADYRGKFVFLNIWATWCAPCREEMPSMQRLHEQMAGKNFAMISISIDDDKSEVEKFVNELGLTFPVALDPAQVVAPKYKITGVPETFLISGDGVVMHHVIGPGEWDNPSILSAFNEAAEIQVSRSSARPDN